MSEETKKEEIDWGSGMDEFYTHLGEHYTITGTQALLLATHAHRSKLHLDAATGTGLGPHLLLNSLQQREGAIIVATDFSKPMLTSLHKRMKQSACFKESDKNTLSLKLGVEGVVKIEEEYQGVHLKAYEADSLKLPFQNSIFDSYTAGFSLMIVPDPLQMVKEAYRVLKPGKRAGFTVMREVIAIFNILQEALAKSELPKMALEMEPFLVLGKNPEKVIQMMEESGFKNILHWKVDSVLPYSSGDDVFQDIFKVPFSPTNLSEEEKMKVKKGINEIWEQKFEVMSQDELFSAKGVLFVGEKPADNQNQQ